MYMYVIGNKFYKKYNFKIFLFFAVNKPAFR